MYLSRFTRAFLIAVLFILFPGPRAGAQEEPGYDEIPVFLDIPGFGGLEIPAVIKGNELFLSVTDLFDFLKVRNYPSPGLDSISGFFINPEATYLINHSTGRIRFQERIYTVIKGDLVRTETGLYLKTDYLGRIFGLDCSFNFRTLTVILRSRLELPAIKEMRLEEMRRNLTRLKGEIKADTSLGRTHPFFRLGMADWSAIANEEINGKSEARFNLALGGMFAGGELTTNLYYNTTDPLTEKQQHYLWRYVDNDFRPLRQVLAGKIATRAVSSIYNPVIGVQLTNTPTTFRRSFGTWKLSDITEPGWIVELYVNNVLVDYMKADASGFYSFDVPLVYGNSSVKLKFYGPWGEEKTREQSISIPFNFLPPGTLEYNIGAGIVEDTLLSRFSRGGLNYGLTRSITLGGGIEYLSSVASGPLMPWISSSVRVTNNLLLSGEYMHGVRAKGSLTYRLPSNLQLDLNYTWYVKDQKAINYNYREERKAALSVPFRLGKLSSYHRFTLYQIVLPASQYTTAEWLFSGSLFGVNTNLTSYALFTGDNKPYIYSNLGLAFRLPARFVIMPQVQYGYTQNEFLSAKLRVEKVIGDHAFLNLQYEQNFRNDLKMAELGIRYDFSFAQTGATFRQSSSKSTLIQYARGSLIADTKTRFIAADNRPNVGKGGITILAYLDMNSNGGRDPGEPRVPGLNIHTNGGRIVKSEKDSLIRILGLEPYTNCFIELDAGGFESISWRLPVKTLSVTVDPEILKLVEIPVAVAGEASGTVMSDREGEMRGMGRIIMHFTDEMSNLVARTLTGDDGYYSYLGLAPGRYRVAPDTSQLMKLGMFPVPLFREFSINAGREGDYVSDLDFEIRKITPDTVAEIIPEKPADTLRQIIIPVKPVTRKDTSYVVVHEVTQELVTVGEDSYAIQLGAFRRRSNAEAYRKKLEALTGRKVEIVIENELFKVRITGLKDRSEVDTAIAKLQANGVTELWLIRQRAKQQQWLLIDRQDTIAEIREITETGEMVTVTPELSIQVGAFRREELAKAMHEKLSFLISKPVLIIPEEGYFKVRVTGFRSREELEKMLPVLGMLGLKDIWIPPVKMDTISRIPVKEPSRPVIDTSAVKPFRPVADTVMKKTEDAAARQAADTSAVKPATEVAVEPAAEEKPPVVKPTVSLHVGEFRKRSQALRAQRKVVSKFDVPVEIYIRWDSYHLVITGFFSREDTFRYYPELAGMGYTNIYVIQEK